jgi:transcriptional regulator with XRE-family HTH domain
MSTAQEALIKEFADPEARNDYAEFLGDSWIALQIKALRLQRNMSQKDLAQKAGMKQSRISAMEQATYSQWSVSTLRRLARAFDLALVVSFESFGTLLEQAASSNRETLQRLSFPDDPAFKGSVVKPEVISEPARLEKALASTGHPRRQSMKKLKSSA